MRDRAIELKGYIQGYQASQEPTPLAGKMLEFLDGIIAGKHKKSPTYTPQQMAAKRESMVRANKTAATEARKALDQAIGREENPVKAKVFVVPPPANELSDADWPDIKADLAKGKTKKELAGEYGVPQTKFNEFVGRHQLLEARKAG